VYRVYYIYPSVFRSFFKDRWKQQKQKEPKKFN
jgi:hypothetical protein